MSKTTQSESPPPRNWHMFAWDHVQFPVPEDWDLAAYRPQPHGADLILEDATDVRLELNWRTEADQAALTQGERRHRQCATQLAATAADSAPLADTPPAWIACRYRMKDRRCLITAFWIGPPGDVLAALRLHASPTQTEAESIATAQRLLHGFTWQTGDLLAWRVYGLDLSIPRRFRLHRTSFLAGRQMMLFESRLRRLVIWRFSLVSRILARQSAADFIATFLGQARELPGVRGVTDDHGALLLRPKPIHLFGHYENIGRWCFHYHLEYHLCSHDDSLAIMVFHYRRPADLSWLAGTRFPPPPP